MKLDPERVWQLASKVYTKMVNDRERTRVETMQKIYGDAVTYRHVDSDHVMKTASARAIIEGIVAAINEEHHV